MECSSEFPASQPREIPRHKPAFFSRQRPLQEQKSPCITISKEARPTTIRLTLRSLFSTMDHQLPSHPWAAQSVRTHRSLTLLPPRISQASNPRLPTRHRPRTHPGRTIFPRLTPSSGQQNHSGPLSSTDRRLPLSQCIRTCLIRPRPLVLTHHPKKRVSLLVVSVRHKNPEDRTVAILPQHQHPRILLRHLGLGEKIRSPL